MQARAREKAVEYVEKNMSYAKDALTSEMQNIMRQFDRGALERQTFINDLQTYQTRLMDQEKSLVLWKLMAMNGAMSVPYYMDDPTETAQTANSSLSLSRV